MPKTLFSDHTFIKELSRRGIAMIRDLFHTLDSFTDYPLTNLVFSNRLEQFWNTVKREKCTDNKGNSLTCRVAFRLNSLEGELKSDFVLTFG
jgi:hypothetical protein